MTGPTRLSVLLTSLTLPVFGCRQDWVAGKFEWHTIKPAGSPRRDLPAHIHVPEWTESCFSLFVNKFLFDDDERLTGEIQEQSIRNRFLIQPPEKAEVRLISSFPAK